LSPALLVCLDSEHSYRAHNPVQFSYCEYGLLCFTSYVYDLPAEFNYNLLARNPACGTDKFSSEVRLAVQMLSIKHQVPAWFI